MSFAKRLVTVAVLLPLIVMVLRDDVFSCVFAVLAVTAAYYEHATFLVPGIVTNWFPPKSREDKSYGKGRRIESILLAAGLASVFPFDGFARSCPSLITPTLFLVLFARLCLAIRDFKENNQRIVVVETLLHIFGFVGLVWPFMLAVYLRLHVTGKGLQMVTFFCAYASDNGGLLFGRLLKGPKLCEYVSPKKTWAGLLGSIVLSCLTAYLFSEYKDVEYVRYIIGPLPKIPYYHALLMGFIIAIFGTLGDLIESIMKRSARVKDASSFIPGHGGFLDRMDSLIYALPAVHFLVALAPGFIPDKSGPVPL